MAVQIVSGCKMHALLLISHYLKNLNGDEKRGEKIASAVALLSQAGNRNRPI